MRIVSLLTAAILLTVFMVAVPRTVKARQNSIGLDATHKAAERQVHQLIDPLIERYCHDSCKILSIKVNVGIAEQEQVTPGFDDDFKPNSDIAPSSADVKLLIDDKMGPISRRKLLDLLQQFLDSLDYPVHIDTQIAHFPLPEGSESKIAELRNRVAQSFQNTLKDLFSQFCPQTCLLADFNMDTAVVNGEETQYGQPGEYIQDGDAAIKIKEISATLLLDQYLTPEEQNNILEMAKLKTNSFKHVNLAVKSMKFPKLPREANEERAVGSGKSLRTGLGTSRGAEMFRGESNITSNQKTDETNSNTETRSENKSDTVNQNETHNKNEQNSSTEKHEHYEKIERVENGDAVQVELNKFKVFGLIFACSVLALLIFIAISSLKTTSNLNLSDLGSLNSTKSKYSGDAVLGRMDSSAPIGAETAKRIEIEKLYSELSTIYAQQPRVAKYVFSKVLMEEGVEATAACMYIFGENIVVEMLRDPSLQRDITELMDYYAKNPLQLNNDEKLDILRRLYNRTVTGKLSLIGNMSSNLFEFLTEMDSLQIIELIRTESLTVKAIVLTQCDAQKRASIYSHFDPSVKMDILTELTRIDYLPRDYIFNVAHALKRKRKENPRLNTEALPGSEVLLSLLEQTHQKTQQDVLKNLETSNPESARLIKNKLVSLDTLRYLRDAQMLEVVLSLKYEELLQFLKGAPEEIRTAVLSRSPKDLVAEIEGQLGKMTTLSREAYHSTERKILNRMKVMANDGHINLLETNERMFGNGTLSHSNQSFVAKSPMHGTAQGIAQGTGG